jgi:hypothetical protein
MTRIKTAVLAAGVLLLAGCDSFVPPQVACDQITVDLSDKQKSPRAGMPCPFADASSVVISHSPRVDPAWAEANGGVGDLSLANLKIEVVSGSQAVFLCDGIGCPPKELLIEPTLDSRGNVAYTVLIARTEFGANPDPGGSVTLNGVLAIENYGPGNSCPIMVTGTVTCEEADPPQQN